MNETDTFEIDGKAYTQYWEDSDGNGPSLSPGTRVYIKSEKQFGTIKHQQLHFDGSMDFFGNVIVHLDDNTYIRTNGWMCHTINGHCLINTFTVQEGSCCSLGTLGCKEDHNLDLFKEGDLVRD